MPPSKLQRSRDVAAAETRSRVWSADRQPASTEPRRCRRGNLEAIVATWRGTFCFNGAATLPPRKPFAKRTDDGGPVASTEPRRCRRGNTMGGKSFGLTPRGFNGAATLPPRKPRSTACKSRRGPGSFNGAATLPPRKRARHRHRPRRAQASTEPRRCRRGNVTSPIVFAAFSELQRSRDVAAAETRLCACGAVVNIELQRSRDVAAAETARGAKVAYDAVVLQRSRDVAAAETAAVASIARGEGELQRSRDVAAAETDMPARRVAD